MQLHGADGRHRHADARARGPDQRGPSLRISSAQGGSCMAARISSTRGAGSEPERVTMARISSAQDQRQSNP